MTTTTHWKHLAAALCAAALAACGGGGGGDKPAPPDRSYATAVGTPIGAQASRVIGAAGGTLASADGSVSVEVPPGAFNGDQTVSLQEISNEAHGTPGRAWRILPEGLHTTLPMTLRMRYGADEGDTAAAKRIASQDAQGRWVLSSGISVDTATRTLSVQTTHFSDWSMFDSVWLIPKTATLLAGQSLTLETKRCQVIDVVQGSEELRLIRDCQATATGLRQASVDGAVGGNAGVGTVALLSADPAQSTGVRYSAPRALTHAITVAVSADVPDPAPPPGTSPVFSFVSKVTVLPAATTCLGGRLPVRLEGDFSFDYSFNGESLLGWTLATTQHANTAAHLTLVASSATAASWRGPLTGLVSVDLTRTIPGPIPYVLHDEGAGAPDASPNDSGTNSQVMVSLNRETCRYDVSVSVRVMARETLSTGNESHEYIYNIGDYRADWRPVTSTQSWTETADFTAHTEEWGLVYEGDAYFPGSTGTLIFDEHFAEEGKAGVARVRWAMELVY